MYAIFDNNGMVHSGSEYEMNKAFSAMVNDTDSFMEDYDLEIDEAQSIQDDFTCDWDGILHLVEIKQSYN